MTSQLGRVILVTGYDHADAASQSPNDEGAYSPMDGFLDELSDQIQDDSDSSGDRRPGDESSSS